jgi:ligand-binding sensor domain-containing protein
MTEATSSSAADLAHQLAQGIAAAQAGRHEDAQRLLAEVVGGDPGNDLAWLWLAAVADDPQQRAEYIARAVAANPERRPGQRRLSRLAPLPSRTKRDTSKRRLSWPFLGCVGLLLCLGGVAGIIWAASMLQGWPGFPLAVVSLPAESTATETPGEEIPATRILPTPGPTPFPAPIPPTIGGTGQALVELLPQAGLQAKLNSSDRVQVLLATGTLKWLGTDNGLIRWDQAAGTLARFTRADSLPGNDVRALALADGDLWVGTRDAGAARFDGRTWTTIRVGDGLADDRVTVIGYQSPQRTIWIGTQAGLSRYDTYGQWQGTFTAADGLPGDHVTALAFGDEGDVWVSAGTDGPALAGYNWRRETWQPVNVAALGEAPITALAPSAGQGLWAGTQAGRLAHFDGGTWQVLALPDALMGGTIRSITGDDSLGLWVAVEGRGLSRYDGQAWEVYLQAFDSSSLESALLTTDDQHQLWAATAQGLYQFSEADFTPIDPDPGAPRLAGAWINDLAVDSQGALWIATLRGAMRYDPVTGIWQTFTSEDGLSDTQVAALALDQAGILYAAARMGWDSAFDGQHWSTMGTNNVGDILPPQALAVDPVRLAGLATAWPENPWPDLTAGLDEAIRIHAIALDAEGRPWLATSEGIWERSSGNWVQVTPPGDQVDHQAYAILVDQAGQVWVGLEDGVARFDPQAGSATWESFDLGDGLAGNRVLIIFEAADGSLWFGTANGLSQYDGQSWRSFTTAANGWPLGDVVDIVQDQAGGLWAATPGALLRFDGQAWAIAAAANLAAGAGSGDLVAGRDGQVWMSVPRGGLLQYEDGIWHQIDARAGVPIDWIIMLASDEENGLWAGSNSDYRLAHFDGQAWEVISAVGDLRLHELSALAADGRDGFWALWGESQVMSHFQAGAWQSFELPSQVGLYNRFLLTRSGQVWLGTEDYVARWSDGTWDVFDRELFGYSDDQVHFGALAEDSSGRIWVNTEGYGIAPQDKELRRYDGSGWAEIELPRILDFIDGFAMDAGGFWLDGEGVVGYYAGGRWRVYAVPAEVAGRNVRHVALDSSGRVWVLGGDGLAWLEPHAGRWESRLVFRK